MKKLVILLLLLLPLHICNAQKIVTYELTFCDLPPGNITLTQLRSGNLHVQLKHPAGAVGKVIGFDMIIAAKKTGRTIYDISHTNIASPTMQSAMMYLRAGDSFIITNIRVDFGRGATSVQKNFVYTIF